jgi:hypothetical protein
MSANQHFSMSARALSGAFSISAFCFGFWLNARFAVGQHLCESRFGEAVRVVPRLIASSPTAIAATTVEPATAISVVTMVSEASVVAARRPTAAACTATTGAENEAYDHGDHDYRHKCEEHSHPNSPFTGFPRFRLQLPGSTTLL